MSKAKFSVARELINEKKFDEARSILRTIDHPTALEWLKKLDQIAPSKSASNNPPLRKSFSKSRKIATTQVNSKNILQKNQFTIGIIAIVSILIVVMFLLILIPKMINDGGNVPSSEMSQSQPTTVVALNSTQIESLVIYCMKQTDLLRDECTTFAQNISNDSETSSIAAQCTVTYANNLDSLTICMRDVETILELRVLSRHNQRGALYMYCGGNHSEVTLQEFISLADDGSPSFASDKDCREWAVKLDRLHPSMLSAIECVGSTNKYYDLLYGAARSGSESARNEFVDVVNCMEKNLGEYFPPLPVCDTDHPKRVSCQKPKN